MPSRVAQRTNMIFTIKQQSKICEVFKGNREGTIRGKADLRWSVRDNCT